jgi:hypothetical protein
VINLQEKNKGIKRVRITGRQTDLDSNGVHPVQKHSRRMLWQSALWSVNKAQKDTAVSQRTTDRPVCNVNCAVMRNAWREGSGKFVFLVKTTAITRTFLFAVYRISNSLANCIVRTTYM